MVQPGLLRADLHVHSCYSTESGNLRFLKSRDCYSRPEDVYRVARARGMDVVTITDHDSIRGCLELLDRRPDGTDVFVSEEISCLFPGTDIQVHLGAYGLSEALHRDLQSLRGNVFEVAAALREAGVFFSLNHLFHFYRGQIPLLDYLRLLHEVPALETRNGTMLPAHNQLAARIAARGTGGGPMGAVGGSDAHTLRRVGRTWTEAPGATADDFLLSLPGRQCRVGGAHGTASDIARDAYGVIGAYVASLMGIGPRDHSAWHRAGCLLFAAVSLPAQFLPLAIAQRGKLAERREVRRASAQLAEWLDTPASRPAEAQA